MSDQSSSSDTTPTPKLEGPRPARLEEREALIAMINAIFRSSVGRPETIGLDWPHIYAPENLSNVAVVADVGDGEVGGKLVASTGVWVCDVEIGEARLRVGGINCVGTLPDYRRHGLGGQMMAAAHQTMREQGCHIGLLSTGISNWYRRMGWVEGVKTRDYRLNRGNIALLPVLSNNIRVVISKLPLPTINNTNTTKNPSTASAQANLNVADGAISEGIVHLHNNQRMGAPRTLDLFRQLAFARRADTLVVALPADQATDSTVVDLDTSMPSAYLLLRENFVMEWAGETDEVLGLVRATYEALDDPDASTSLRQSEGGPMLLRRLILQTPGWQQPITEYLDVVGIPYDGDYLGMIYVIDPQGIADAYGLDKLDITIREVKDDGARIGEESFLVSHQGESILLDRRQLAKFLFGPERITPIAAAHLPLPFWQWGLEMV